ncbi:hypothetical protein QJR26_18695 (plasmid) [Clostridium baratii]
MAKTTKDKINKPVYFNLNNEKEKEIIEWLDGKFSSYGGLVKDLLYQEMLREKNGIKISVDNNKYENKKEDIAKRDEVVVTASDVADYDC